MIPKYKHETKILLKTNCNSIKNISLHAWSTSHLQERLNEFFVRLSDGKLTVNQIKKVLPYVNCLQETLRGTKLLDQKFKELEHHWQNNN